MVSTETQFDIARIPIDAAKGAAKLAVWPLHFGKTVVTNAVDTAFKVAGTNTEDEPHTADSLPEGESVYDNAKYNMDIAGMIYYYTELRAETKKLVGQFCTGLSPASRSRRRGRQPLHIEDAKAPCTRC